MQRFSYIPQTAEVDKRKSNRTESRPLVAEKQKNCYSTPVSIGNGMNVKAASF